MTKKPTVLEHLKDITTLMSQLANIGIVVLDEELVDCIVTSLPSNWNIFRQMVFGKEHLPSFP